MSNTPVTLKNATDTQVREAYPSANYQSTGRLRLNNTSSQHAYAFIYFARPFPLGSTVVSATLRLYADGQAGAWSAVSRTITASPVQAPWKVSVINWNNQPSVNAATAVANTQTTSITDGFLWSFDVTTAMQNVSNGTPWYGFRLDINEATLRRLYSANSPTSSTGVSYKPALDVTYALAPAAPSLLIPSGGNATPATLPVLSFDFTDHVADSDLYAVNVQVSAANDFTNSLDYDTGTYFTTQPQVDLSSVTVNLLSNPTFLTNTTGWAARSNCSISRVTTPVKDAAGALQMSSTAAGTMSSGTPTGTSGIPITGGQAYSASGWVRANTTVHQGWLQLSWYDVSGALISSVGAAGSNDSSAAYNLQTVTGTAPSNAKFVALTLTVNSTSAGGEIHFWDALALSLGASPPSYTGVPEGGSTFWRARVQDTAGIWSGWSDPANFYRFSYGTLTVTNPA